MSDDEFDRSALPGSSTFSADERRNLDWSDSSGKSATPRPADGLKSAGGPSSMQRSARIEDMNSLKVSDSPCVAVCSTLYDDICRGCGRTAMEVANWVFLSDDEKRAIWVRIRSQGYPRRNKR